MGMQFDRYPFNEDKEMCSEFLRLKEKFNIESVIETGTHKGVTTKWLAENFNQVYTTEINPTYFGEARVLLSGVSNVESILGDSVSCLPGILDKCTDNTIVFLDAHWYTNPVLNELKAIAESGKKPILAIHDFKNPNHPDYGYDVYPDQNIVYEWSWIESHILAIYGKDGFTHYYNDKATGAKRGCVFIIPNPC